METTEWTATEEQIIAHIQEDETMHDPKNTTGDIRIQCTRAEALRRLQRRRVGGGYQPSTKPWILANIHLAVTQRAEMTPDLAARLMAGRVRRHAEQPL